MNHIFVVSFILVAKYREEEQGSTEETERDLRFWRGDSYESFLYLFPYYSVLFISIKI